MKRGLINCILLFVTLVCNAQQIRFIVVEAETNVPIEGVEVFSHELHDKIVYSTKTGSVKFDVKNTDTLVFFKRNYTPFYLNISQQNFDRKNHVIHLKMVKDNKTYHNVLPDRFSAITKNEYQYSQDTVSQDLLNITRYEANSSDLTQDKAFRLVEIKLADKNISAGRKRISTRR